MLIMAVGGYTSGIVGGAYHSGTTNIINTCSLVTIPKYGANFYYVWGGMTVGLKNCFYPASMKKNNKNIEVNERKNKLYNSTQIIYNKKC